MAKKFYITTSSASVDKLPDIDFLLELLQADVLARYNRKKGKDVFFLTSTSEYGIKILKKAEEEKKDPQDFVNEVTLKYRIFIEKLNISNNSFIRTTDKDLHLKGTQKIWREMKEKGDVYKKKHKSSYCAECDAFVEKKKLVSGKCPNHGKHPENVEEESYFFNLSKYKEKIKEKIEKEGLQIFPRERKNEIICFLEEVEDVIISRPKEKLSWGISVPDDDNQTISNWVDALSSYLTALGYQDERDDFWRWWPPDAHCIERSVLVSHGAFLPGILLSLGLDLPKNIYVHGHMACEGKKKSKKLARSIDLFNLLEDWSSDIVRYYFLRESLTCKDGRFSYKKLKEECDIDLIDGLNSLVYRVISFARKMEINSTNIPRVCAGEVGKEIKKTEKQIEDFLGEYMLKEALESIWGLICFANKYTKEKEIMEKRKSGQEGAKEMLCLVHSLSKMLSPFLPSTAKKMEASLRDLKEENIFSKIPKK